MGEERGRDPAATELLLIRHAQSLGNAEGRWQGQDDSALSRSGRAQAENLARSLAREPADVLVASPLLRAAQTAAPLAVRWGCELRYAPELAELDAGAWAGLTRDEIAARWPEELIRFDNGDPDAATPGGESRRALGRRVGRALLELAAAEAGARVAVVTHLGVIAALLSGVHVGNAECRRVAVAELDLEGLARSGVAGAG